MATTTENAAPIEELETIKDSFYRAAEKLVEVAKILEPHNDLYSLLFLNHAHTLIMYLEKETEATQEKDEDINDIIAKIKLEIESEINE